MLTMNPLMYQVTAISDVGLSRSLNEDSFLVDDNLGLFAVADGMGGHSNGDVASSSVIKHLQEKISAYSESKKDKPSQSSHYNYLEQSIESCNQLVLSLNEENGIPIGSGMGTTLVGLYLLATKNEAVLFNVGDSRVYRLRGKEMVQVTKDHTMYQNWFESGQKGEPPSKNILINAIGLLENIRTDLTLEKLEAGDVYLICSDGLTANLKDSDLLEILLKKGSESDSEICSELVAKANDAGGDDNTTVIVVSVAESSEKGMDKLPEIQTTILSESGISEANSTNTAELAVTVERPVIKQNDII